MKTSRSIYPLLSHHHILQGDPKWRIWHLGAPDEICKSFLRCSSPVTSLPSVCKRFLLPQHRESKAWPCCSMQSLVENLPSSPAEAKPLGFPSSALGAGTARLCQRCEGVAGGVVGPRRGSGGVIASSTTPARPAGIHLPDPAVRPRRSAGSTRGWAVASSEETCRAGEGSHPAPDSVAPSLLTLERHQRR